MFVFADKYLKKLIILRHQISYQLLTNSKNICWVQKTKYLSFNRRSIKYRAASNYPKCRAFHKDFLEIYWSILGQDVNKIKECKACHYLRDDKRRGSMVLQIRPKFLWPIEQLKSQLLMGWNRTKIGEFYTKKSIESPFKHKIFVCFKRWQSKYSHKRHLSEILVRK